MLRGAGVVAGAVLAADQATKAITHHLPVPAGGWLQPVDNPDLLMSLHLGDPFPVTVLIVAALVGFSVHLLHLARHGTLPVWVAGLLVGGAVSNLLDRILLAAVRDWVALPWVVINLADLAVAAGAVGYLAAGARWVAAEWPNQPSVRPANS